MKLPNEIINYILSYRPAHPIAEMIKDEIEIYNWSMVEYISHTRTFIIRGKPHEKKYYDIKPCVENISFSQYCLHPGDYFDGWDIDFEEYFMFSRHYAYMADIWFDTYMDILDPDDNIDYSDGLDYLFSSSYDVSNFEAAFYDKNRPLLISLLRRG